MNNELHNKKIAVDEDIAKLKNDMKLGRIALDFDGMDTMTILQRSEYVRHSLYSDRSRLPENAHRLVNETNMESDREDYFPNVHLLCEKMIASSEKRYEKAERAFSSAKSGIKVRPGKKALGVRGTIDAKLETAAAKELAAERKQIDTQKKEMGKFIKMAPDSSYAAMISDILRQNERSYQLAAKYLSARSSVERYEEFEKLGAIVEEEKKLCILAKEKEAAAKLCLDNHKQSCFVLQERDAILKFNNKALMMQAHAGLLGCAKDALAFIAVPKEMTERLLEQGLMRSESKYYDALQAKQNLSGFHPFKKMALNREIKNAAKEYNEGRALLTDTPENKLKYPPLTTLEEWKKQNSIPIEKMEYGDDEIACEIPVETIVEEKPEAPQTIQLDLSDRLHTSKAEIESAVKKEEEKVIPEIEKGF